MSSRGRPLEFHCTAPVSANRAQQILFGQTLKEFVCCDQIAVSLIKKARSNIDMIMVEDRVLFATFEQLQIPVVYVSESKTGCASAAYVGGSVLEVGGQQFESIGENLEQVQQWVGQFVRNLPATEPFERIRMAISEAHAEAA